MDCSEAILQTPAIAYEFLLKSVLAIPLWHYSVGGAFMIIVFLYNFLEFHFFQDLFTGFRGEPIFLTYNPSSEIYHGVVSKCKTLRGRYLATPWLSSPHIQTSFINFFGRPPVFTYRRQMFHASDGGTFALDWLLHSDVSGIGVQNHTVARDDTTPIVIVVPGLTSDSSSPYMKHLVFDTAKRGWNVVVSNHRGLGGVSVITDCFYNAGWTEDVREVIKYLHQEYFAAPLFVVGTSIGANILVKYLGEDGEDVPIAGAAAVFCRWDLLIGSRFISRRLIQKLFDRALTIGLQGYAQFVRKKIFDVGTAAYGRCEVVAMEWLVQEVLNLQCFIPTSYNFLWFYIKAARANENVEKTAKYLAVLTLMGHQQLCFWPSTIAAGLVILASIASNEDASCHRVTTIHARLKDTDLPQCLKSLE